MRGELALDLAAGLLEQGARADARAEPHQRRIVRRRLGHAEAEEAAEGDAVARLARRLDVGEGVQLL